MAQDGVIGILRVLLTAETAQFDTNLKKASGSVKEFESNTSRTAGAVTGLLGRAIAGVAVGTLIKNL
jgi:hypothetical protein